MLGHGMSPSPTWWSGDITMTFNAGVAAVGHACAFRARRATATVPISGIYAQDRWSFKRATVPAACATTITSATCSTARCRRAAGTRRSSSPVSRVQTWKDFSPRVGVAYDLFGNGKTAVKWSIARYVSADGVSTAAANNPQTTVGRTDTRTWNDLNGDFTIYNADGSLQANELGPTTNAELRQGHPVDEHPGSGDAQRLQRARLDDRVAGGRAARADAARRADRRLLLPLQRQPAGDRQHARSPANDFDGPFCITAPASPGSAGRRRLSGLRALRHQGRVTLAAAEQHDVRAQFRRHRRSLHGLRLAPWRRASPTAPSSRAASTRSGGSTTRATRRRCQLTGTTAKPGGQPRGAVLPPGAAVPARLQAAGVVTTCRSISP